jgi:multidrug efflux system membrane fusion protein
MGTLLQALADRIGDTPTLLIVAMAFGAAAALATLAIKGGMSIVGRMRVAVSRTWLLTVGGAAAVAYIGWQVLGGGSHHAAPTEAQAQSRLSQVPVHTAVVERKPFSVVLHGLGTVQPMNIVTVRSRVDGQIENIAFTEGQMVREGELLVQIDPAPFQAALNQAIAKEAQDQASYRNAKQDLQRTSVLVPQGNATQQLLDQRVAQVAQLAAQLQADQAAIESARVQLNYTTIRSPLTGRVGFRLIDRGNIVHANDQNGMLTITQLQPISVVFTAPEQQLPAISSALKANPLKVTALSSDAKQQLGEGTLFLIDNQVDPASGTIRLKASFNNEDNALWPGLSVATRLLLQTLPDAIVVPDKAVQRGPSGLYAYVVAADGTAQMRNLKVGRIEGGDALVEEGLKAGEQIVTSGQYRLQPGAPLEILRAAEGQGSEKFD